MPVKADSSIESLFEFSILSGIVMLTVHFILRRLSAFVRKKQLLRVELSACIVFEL